jgi:hypothetical protein
VNHFINKPRAALLTFMLIGFASPGTMRAQTYYFSAPVIAAQGKGNGYQEIPFADGGNPNSGPFNNNGNGGGKYPGFSSDLSFGTVNGTLVYNPAASTMRLLGNVAISYDTFGSSFNDNQMVKGSLVPAQVGVNYSVGNVNNGVLSFDSGVVQPMNGSTARWQMNMQLPISGNYSFTSGGQTYNGAFNYTLNLGTTLSLQSASSGSLNFSQDTVPDAESLAISLAQVDAGNGSQMNLFATDPSDGQTYVSWHVDNITAEAPEPGSFAIAGLGLLLVMVWRRRYSTRP